MLHMPFPSKIGCSACARETELFPFSMAFQPIVDVDRDVIVAHEALVRGPDGASAQSVLSQVNGENLYSFDQACRVRAIEMAVAHGFPVASDCRLNINFLPNAVYEPRACIRRTLEAARRTGFPLDRLTFEFVEHEDIADQAHTLRIVEEYRRHGFLIALDDFGTGYSGLARLAQLRPDIVKLDRELVRDCDTDRYRLEIIAAIIGLGRAVGIKVVLEGIERAGEFAALRSVGGRFMQGYFFGRPRFEGMVQVGELGHLAACAA